MNHMPLMPLFLCIFFAPPQDIGHWAWALNVPRAIPTFLGVQLTNRLRLEMSENGEPGLINKIIWQLAICQRPFGFWFCFWLLAFDQYALEFDILLLYFHICI